MLRLRSVLCLLTALAGPVALADDPIKIGEINPFTGPLAKYGLEVARGHELAVDRINAEGGLLGRKVEIVRGDATTPQQGIASVEQLANADKVDLFSGTYMSPVSAAGSDTALQYGRLYWETIATAQDLTERGLPNFVRTGPNATSFAARSVEAVKNLISPAFGKKPGEMKIWIEHEDMSFGTSFSGIFKRMLAKEGISSVEEGTHSVKDIDLNSTVLRIKRAQPDLLVEVGYVPDGNLLLKNLRDQGYKVPAIMYVVTGDAPETLQVIGPEALESVLVVSYPRPNLPAAFSPGGDAYLAAYRARYKQEPVATVGMTAYAGFQMMFDAVKAAGSTDMKKVMAAAETLDKPVGSYIGGFGFKLDKQEQNTRALPVVIQWQSGEPVTVFPKEAVVEGASLKNLPRK